MRAILLTGPVGSGKTTVLLALGDLLAEQGEPYALVDLDWLAWVNPAPGTLSVDEVLHANLAAVRETFGRAGVERLVLARSLERAEQLGTIRAALPGVELVAVRLTAPRELLEQRLRARDSGGELEQHLAFVARAETALFEDACVPSEHPLSEVALAVLRAARWDT